MHTAPFPHSLTEVLINQAPEFLGIYDVEQQSYTRINPAGVQILGCKSAECFLSRPAPQLRTPHFSEADWAALRTAARQHGRQDARTDVECPDGSGFAAGIEVTYFEDLNSAFFLVRIARQPRLPEVESKRTQSALVAQRLRAERRNAELEQKVADRTSALTSTLGELGKALAAEKKLGELKSLFVALASHEFRSPLTVVLSSAALLEQYPASEQQPQRQVHVERIRQSVRHLNDILEEFLSVARIEEGRVRAYPERIGVAALLADIVADVQGLLKTGQTIVREVSCPETVWLDPSLLRKIVVNLLSNALKYSGENSVVSLRVDCRDNLLAIKVKDQGIGISAADQTHLFERFFRARDVAYVPGTGLGLYIIANYAEMMGGTIDLQSTLAVGTTVTLRIPYEEYPTH